MAAPGKPKPPIPGMNPRPQKFFVQQVNSSETFDSESKSTFVYVQKCEDFNLEIRGKVGKVVCDEGKNLTIRLNQRLVSGTLELIHCIGVEVICQNEAEAPVVTIDGSSGIRLRLERRSQIESIYCHHSKDVSISVCTAEAEEPQEFSVELEGKVAYGAGDVPVQWIGHWASAAEDAHFITEQVVRDGVYPTIAGKKRAAEQREQQAMSRTADMLLRPGPRKVPSSGTGTRQSRDGQGALEEQSSRDKGTEQTSGDELSRKAGVKEEKDESKEKEEKREGKEKEGKKEGKKEEKKKEGMEKEEQKKGKEREEKKECEEEE